MVNFGFYVELKAKSGKEAQVEAFLLQSAALAKNEAGIVGWYAVKEEERGVFGIVDTFADEGAWNAHGTGELAKALFGKAEELFSEPPKVHRLHVIAQK